MPESRQPRSLSLPRCLAAGLALGSAGVAAAGTLSLNTGSCQTTGVVTVTIDMSAAPGVVVGGQFFLNYDKTVLDFVSAVPGGAPFTVEIFESVSEPLGTSGGAPIARRSGLLPQAERREDQEIRIPSPAATRSRIRERCVLASWTLKTVMLTKSA